MGIAITTNITGINKDQNIRTSVHDGSVYYILTRRVVRVESESSTWPTRRVDSTLTRDFDSSNSATRPTLLISEIPFAAAGRTPSRQYAKLRPRVATGGAINIAGLDVLRTYVCPPCANTVRRQMNAKRVGAITVAIPMAEVSELWQELQWILEQLSILLDAEGLLPVSTPTVGLPTMLASVIESAMPVVVLP
jgi:hypothetical protein